MADCTETTRRGTPCKNLAKTGETKCASHLKLARRPSKLTEDVQHKVCAALRSGNFVDPACLFAGIAPATYYAWRERGEADREAGIASAWAEFSEATTRAIAEGEMLAVAQLSQNVQKGDQKAIEFYLERRHPERWGRRDRLELKHGGNIRTDAPEVPSDDDRLSEVGSIMAAIGVLPIGT